MNEQALSTAPPDGGSTSGGETSGEGAPTAETESVVRTLLGVSGLAPDDGEVAILVGAFPTLRAGVASLYAIPDVRYGSPGLIFDADPAFVAWSGTP